MVPEVGPDIDRAKGSSVGDTDTKSPKSSEMEDVGATNVAERL